MPKIREPKLEMNDEVPRYCAAAVDSDPSHYLTVPRIGASALITLVEKLLQLVPQETHGLIAAAAERLKQDSQVLRAALTQNVQPAQTGMIRGPFDRLGRLMSASFERARALAEIQESGPDVDAALFVIGKLFPTRLDFLKQGAWDFLRRSD